VSDRRPWYRGWVFRQALVWGLGLVIMRGLVVPAERCPPVDTAAVQRSIDGAVTWLERGTQPDGRFLYGYYAGTKRTSPLYNDTRHAGILYVLYRAGRIGAGDAGMRHVEPNLIQHGNWSAFVAPGDDADVGAASLLIAALAERRLSTGEARYDTLARRLGRFIVSQTQPDGSVLEFWRPATQRTVPGLHGKFSTGEAMYALALLNRIFPGEGWERPAHRIAGYIATRRDVAEGYATHQPDHWAAYGLAELAPTGLSAAEVAYARRLAGYFGYEIRFESQHTGRPLNMFTESGADLGVVGEGSAALWRLAGEEPRLADLRPQLAERVTCLTGTTVRKQTSPANPDPRLAGAWFYRGYTQMDDQQHAIGALLGAEGVLR
jgi:hypothetical protein